MAHEGTHELAQCSPSVLLEKSLRNLVHRVLVAFTWKQMPVAIHRDLQRRVACESLHGLRRHSCFDPSRNCARLPAEWPLQYFRIPAASIYRLESRLQTAIAR